MKSKSNCLLWVVALIALLLLELNPSLVRASTIVTEEPGNTVVADPSNDLQLKNCDTTHRNRACSLPPSASTAYFPQFDILVANITALPGNGLVEMAIQLNDAVPAAPDAQFLSYFWQFENGCVNGQPGPTSKDGAKVNWDGSNFTANWYVITNCNPRESELGPPIAFNFSSDRKTVSVQVDICDLVSRAGESLTWYSGVRRIAFSNPTFPNTIPVDTAPDVSIFNPAFDPVTNPSVPQVLHPDNPAPWNGACLNIDIKPGSFPNSINPTNEGSIPVAILSNPTFNAPSQVDQTNLFFGRTGNEDSLDFCSGAEDVNGDGLLDLVCHFNTEKTGFQKGDTQGTLKGLTVGPTPAFLLGRDSVRIVPAQ